MIREEPPPAPPPHSIGREIGVAVAIAALSAVVSGFVQWGIEELKALRAKPDEEKAVSESTDTASCRGRHLREPPQDG